MATRYKVCEFCQRLVKVGKGPVPPAGAPFEAVVIPEHRCKHGYPCTFVEGDLACLQCTIEAQSRVTEALRAELRKAAGRDNKACNKALAGLRKADATAARASNDTSYTAGYSRGIAAGYRRALVHLGIKLS